MGSEQIIHLDGDLLGPAFEGIGTLSAGANRLWVDYPEPQMSQMLDLIFKPKYCMSYHHFKIEIGSDMNSSLGTEPAIMRNRAEYERVKQALSSDNPLALEYADVREMFDRGYEFWLAQEAKKRNPHIMLDCLQWAYPGWVGERSNGHQFSEDNAKMLAMFIKGAKVYKGLDFDFVGGDQNEEDYNKEYIKILRKALDDNSLQNVKIVLGDIIDDKIGERLNEELAEDEDFKNSIYAIGSHYNCVWGAFKGKHKNIHLWCGEDGFWVPEELNAREINAALFFAHKLNLNYPEADYTKTIICDPTMSGGWYNTSPLCGYLLAHEPWSGHYDFIPVAWSVAHTTQFTEPGWQFLTDGGCGTLDGGGSYVTYKDPFSDHFSIVIETYKAEKNQPVTINASHLSTAAKHVWLTYGSADETWFKEIDADLAPGQSEFTLELLPNAIYTITTTIGQFKGTDEIIGGKRLIDSIPATTPFPFPYKEDFENSVVNRSPRYFTDDYGYFEVIEGDGADGSKKCLQQKMTVNGIKWVTGNRPPQTLIGSADWSDYEVSVSAKLVDNDPQGYLTLFGRAMVNYGNVNCYQLKVSKDRTWSLVRHDFTEDKWNTIPHSLAEGALESDFDLNQWHNLKLKFNGTNISTYIDDQLIADVIDDKVSKGAVGFGSSFNNARFDNLSIR